jgi:transposase-like protein
MPKTINGIEYLKICEIAEQIGVSRQTLWKWRKDNNIPLGQKFRNKEVLYTLDEVKQIQDFAHRLEPISL